MVGRRGRAGTDFKSLPFDPNRFNGCDPLTKPSSCEACSAFTRVAACTLARSPSRDRYPKASDTSSPPCLLRSLPAGAVAGWGLHPLEKRRLVTAHVVSGPSLGGA